MSNFEIESLKLDLREAESKTEHIKASLKKDVDFLCEDFAEFVGAEATPENYASLEAVCKKMLRALERSGAYNLPEEYTYLLGKRR